MSAQHIIPYKFIQFTKLGIISMWRLYKIKMVKPGIELVQGESRVSSGFKCMRGFISRALFSVQVGRAFFIMVVEHFLALRYHYRRLVVHFKQSRPPFILLWKGRVSKFSPQVFWSAMHSVHINWVETSKRPS